MTTPDQRSHLKDHTRPTEASFLSLEDGDMYVCQDGPQDASTLLLIHGSASSSRSWNPLVPLLAPSHHIIRLDLPGHGRSDEPADRDYKISRQAHRVGSALDRLGVERTIVVGHSSGGVVATALAEQRPELVTALVLINTGPSMEAFLLPESAVTGPSSWPPSDEQIRRFAKTGFGGKDQQVPQELVDDVRGMSHHAFITTMQETSTYMEQQAIPDRLSVLDTPLHVMFGDQDRRWLPSSAHDYRTVPGAKIEFLSGLGHSPILEDPPRTADMLLAFTTAHATRAGRAGRSPH